MARLIPEREAAKQARAALDAAGIAWSGRRLKKRKPSVRLRGGGASATSYGRTAADGAVFRHECAPQALRRGAGIRERDRQDGRGDSDRNGADHADRGGGRAEQSAPRDFGLRPLLRSRPAAQRRSSTVTERHSTWSWSVPNAPLAVNKTGAGLLLIVDEAGKAPASKAQRGRTLGRSLRSSRPPRPPRRRAHCTDGPLLRAAQARTTPARPLRARRRAGRARPRRGGPAGGADTGTATRARTRVAEAKARARRGCPWPAAARPDRRADTAGRRAPLAGPRCACAVPCGASTRTRPIPREPADAARARSGRGRGRRPQPRAGPAGPGLEAVGPPPFVFLAGSRHATTVTVASGSGDRTPAARSDD